MNIDETAKIATTNSEVENSQTQQAQQVQQVQQVPETPKMSDADIKEFNRLKNEEIQRKNEHKVKESMKTAGFKGNIKHILNINPDLKKLNGELLTQELNKMAKEKDTKYLFNGKFGDDIKTEKGNDTEKIDADDLYVEGGTAKRKN
jgi:hypothetical protein